MNPERWSAAFESPDDLWMHLLARAEQEGEEERDELGGWLTSEGISRIAAREWELLREARPTPRD